MAIRVKPLTVPPAGVDTINITIEETYEIDGVGKDTVTLNGTLVANRGVPLLERPGKTAWKSSAVVAQFTRLNLAGESNVFGHIGVSLDDRSPSFGMVINGDCKAAIGVEISIPSHDLTLRTAEPMQLRSKVKTVPPIGDEKTESIQPVRLVDTRTGRVRGTLASARVTWRELTEQTLHRVGRNQ